MKRTKLVVGGLAAMLAFPAIALVAQENEDFDLRRQVMDLIEDAYTRGDTASLRRMIETEQFARSTIRKYRECAERSRHDRSVAGRNDSHHRDSDGLTTVASPLAGGDARDSSNSGHWDCPDGFELEGSTCHNPQTGESRDAIWHWDPMPENRKQPKELPSPEVDPNLPNPVAPSAPTRDDCSQLWDLVDQCTAELTAACAGSTPDACTAATLRCSALVVDATASCSD